MKTKTTSAALRLAKNRAIASMVRAMGADLEETGIVAIIERCRTPAAVGAFIRAVRNESL